MAVTLARRPTASIPDPAAATAPSMEKFVIQGGVPLSGTVVPAGNKNAALPLIASALLTADEVVLHNVPRIRDTQFMLDLIEALGTTVAWRDEHTVALCARDIPSTTVDESIAERIRASFLTAGPLLARFGSAFMPPPGGDVIGRRRLDPHLDAFIALGAKVEHGARDIRIEAPEGLQAAEFFMDEPSVMGTENALMAAALTPGTTVIRNAASEPHVQDLARMLVRMGAAIEGIGSNVMTVHGVGAPERLRALGLAGPHRDRLLHGARGRHRRRAAHQGHGPGRPAHDPARLQAARARLDARGHRRRRTRAARSS